MSELAVPRCDLLITLGALALLLCWEASGLDLTLAHLYGNSGGFALRGHWFFSRLLHDGGRLLSGVVLAAVTAWALLGDGAVMTRRRRLAWVGVLLLCLVAVPAVKRVSSTSCPWDLSDFGGATGFVPHWMLGVFDGGPGHCFPSGHAVAAFAFLPLYFQWRAAQPRAAQAMLAVTLGFGVLFGWAQLARGAHFPSHTMWSAWLCWSIGAVAARVLAAPPASMSGVGQPAAVLAVQPAR